MRLISPADAWRWCLRLGYYDCGGCRRGWSCVFLFRGIRQFCNTSYSPERCRGSAALAADFGLGLLEDIFPWPPAESDVLLHAAWQS